MAIHYLQHKHIDKSKWDNCIAKSLNGLIYSTSVYLDHMATCWDALVMDDYSAVMPLPFRKKYGFYYVYPPAFSQQMGITGMEEITEKIVDLFLNSIPKKFSYVEINLNTGNNSSSSNSISRDNYFLPLSSSFEVLQQNFSRSAKRNIKKAMEENVSTKEGVDPAAIIGVHRQRFKDEVGANDEDYKRLEKLFAALKEKNMLFTIGAFKENKLIAGSVYFVYKNRITFIINGNNSESLKIGATHLLMNETIKKFCNKKNILDFEGSDFEEFVRFYTQYGAIGEKYSMIKMNRLPWPLSLFKK